MQGPEVFATPLNIIAMAAITAGLLTHLNISLLALRITPLEDYFTLKD